MRISAGKYKGRSIASPPGRATRPALARIRQAVFDTLQPWLEDGYVLD
ncbi:RsmD family RNA methyltransferase, partial [Planctomycetota bacterium]